MKLPRRFPLEMESYESGGSVHLRLQRSGPTIKFHFFYQTQRRRSLFRSL